MNSRQFKKTGYYLFVLFFLFTAYCFAQDDNNVNVTADHLEYPAETNMYIAKGSVKIVYGDAVLTADEAYLNKTTGEATAIGHVVYEDAEAVVKAEKMELNFMTRFGTLYKGSIFYKSRNYHIQGGDVSKTGEQTFSINNATATTCDATPPEWYFKGRDIKITLHESVKAKDATFYVKGLPLFYTPYFWAPLLEERQTGLLIPHIGFNNTKGFMYKQGFFWAIEKNRDATVYLDYFSKKGVGKGLDYRFIESPETNGELWMYHLRDGDLKRDFFELKSYYNQGLPAGMSGYSKLHFVNSFDYYKKLESTSANRIGLSTWQSDVFGVGSEERLQKYLESDLQLSKPFSGGRTYVLGQYRQSLEGSSKDIPQSIPEAGFILNTRSRGPFSLNMSFTGTNFQRKEGMEGQRLDIYPNAYFSYGRAVNFTQKIGVRETAYFLKAEGENANRELFDLRSGLTTRFFRDYESTMHAIEPSLEYVHIPAVDHNDIPEFDSIDSMPQTSDIVYSLTNRFSGSALGSSEARFRLSQSYSLLNVERPFAPVLAEADLSSKKLDIDVSASYDVYDTTVTETIASVNVKGKHASAGIGKNFRRSTKLDQYSVEAGIHDFLKVRGKPLPVDLSGRLWYDVKGAGVQELNIRTIYKSQCWGITISYTKKPSEYQITFGIEFRGFGSIKVG
ncbi:MAG: LPS-assembly protein LptD [Nitrospirae bacterium]|nr:LPS-assembly protein LptD [Nitrospirota bacterium]